MIKIWLLESMGRLCRKVDMMIVIWEMVSGLNLDLKRASTRVRIWQRHRGIDGGVGGPPRVWLKKGSTKSIFGCMGFYLRDVCMYVTYLHLWAVNCESSYLISAVNCGVFHLYVFFSNLINTLDYAVNTLTPCTSTLSFIA